MNRTRHRCAFFVIVVAVGLRSTSAADAPQSFTRLGPVEPTILAAARAFPGGGYEAENILKVSGPGARRAYASDHLAERTFIDFDLGRAEPVAAFRHVQRRTPDTIAEANLVFSATPDFVRPIATVKIEHVDAPGATTFEAFRPVRARYVRWQVTSVLPGRSPNVGGRSIELFAARAADETPRGIAIEAHTVPIIRRQAEGDSQPRTGRTAPDRPRQRQH